MSRLDSSTWNLPKAINRKSISGKTRKLAKLIGCKGRLTIFGFYRVRLYFKFSHFKWKLQDKSQLVSNFNISIQFSKSFNSRIGFLFYSCLDLICKIKHEVNYYLTSVTSPYLISTRPSEKCAIILYANTPGFNVTPFRFPSHASLGSFGRKCSFR